MTAVMGEPRYAGIKGDEMPRPVNLYACTKLFGEQMGEVYAKTRDLPVTCLRLGQPYSAVGKQTQYWLSRPRSRGLFVQGEDIASAVALACRQSLPFAVYPIVSRSDAQWVQPSAYAELGYEPRYFFTSKGPELISPGQ
jgi:uronate dehydrogenase